MTTKEKIKPMNVYFELGRFKLTKEIYHPSELEGLTAAERNSLRKVSDIVYVEDPFYGADLKLHTKAFDKPIEQLFRKGRLSVFQKIKRQFGIL